VTGRVNYTHHYHRDFGAATFYGVTGATASTIPQTGFLKPKAPSVTTYDLFVRYAVTPNLTLNGAVINITDVLPPYEPGVSTTYFYDRTQYDARGRYYMIGARYTF
jgi:outer membrane receptor protein involved in Fe transport